MPAISSIGLRRRNTRPAHYSRAAARLLVLCLSLLPASVGLAEDRAFTQETEARMLALVNGLRGENGLKSLERDSRLDDAAAYLAGYMARAGRLDHRADGSTPPARVKERGYRYCDLAENIGMEYDSRGYTAERLAGRFVKNWRNSPPHRANLLHPRATQTGLGVARNSAGEYYAVQVFARPPLSGVRTSAACPR